MKDWKTIAAVGLVGVALTLARRWNNTDRMAGAGVAGWTVIIILMLLRERAL